MKTNHPDRNNESLPTENAKFLLSNEAFELLRKAQDRIKDKTDMLPTLRKLVNELITEDHVNEVCERMIMRLNANEITANPDCLMKTI